METVIKTIIFKCNQTDCYFFNRCVLANSEKDLKDKIKYTPYIKDAFKAFKNNRIEFICVDKQVLK